MVNQLDLQNARNESSNDINLLLRMFAELNSAARSELLANTTQAIATSRPDVQTAKEPENAASAWLQCVAENAYPRTNSVSKLFSLTSDYDDEWEERIFTDGKLRFVNCLAEELENNAEELLAGYEYLKETAHNGHELPVASVGLGIHLSRQQYENWVGETLVFDNDAYQEAVRNACVQDIRLFLSKWRNDFFIRLLGLN